MSTHQHQHNGQHHVPDGIEAPVPGERQSDSYQADKQRILARLRRMEGQVRGVQRMVEDDKYCVDILTQLSSIIAAARAIGLVILEDHIHGCVLNADDKEAAAAELMEAIERFTKSVG
ncbi:MAG TPA: metal-sensitive transcriptional regulator [Thermomicrobiales bacterium]|nr:metal-sensitive transcriptional regulator [Thermomicrobiales bacterium]